MTKNCWYIFSLCFLKLFYNIDKNKIQIARSSIFGHCIMPNSRSNKTEHVQTSKPQAKIIIQQDWYSMEWNFIFYNVGIYGYWMNLNLISIHRFQLRKRAELILTFDWPKFFELRIYGYLINLYSVSIQWFQ